MLIRKTAIAAALAALCTGAAAAPAPITTFSVGANAGGIAFDPVLRYAFVTNYDDGTVSEIDVDTLAVTATIPAGEKPRRVVKVADAGAPASVLRQRHDARDRDRHRHDGERHARTHRRRRSPAQHRGGLPARRGVRVQPRQRHAVGHRRQHEHRRSDRRDRPQSGRHRCRHEASSGLRRKRCRRHPHHRDENKHVLLQKVAVGRNPASAIADERTGKVYVNNVDDRTIPRCSTAPPARSWRRCRRGRGRRSGRCRLP